MKSIFISDLKDISLRANFEVQLFCWLRNKRRHGGIVFLDLCDSSGTIQAIADKSILDMNAFDLACRIQPESSLIAVGTVGSDGKLKIANLQLLGAASLAGSLRPRSTKNVLATPFRDQVLRNCHLYLRNEKVMAIMMVRHWFLGAMHSWFRDKGFIEITAPILTPLPLYDPNTALKVNFAKESIYLTQCVGFYLESAVHAFERVYNIGPSFRGEESRSRRHLMEYWHIKAELAFVDREDLISIVETMINQICDACVRDCQCYAGVIGTKMTEKGVKIPYPRIAYRDALTWLARHGKELLFGQSIGSDEETLLSREFDTPFWVTGIPRTLEAFPYRIDPDDPDLTLTADLIAPDGYGELLGVAEKISNKDELIQRLSEKGLLGDPLYNWLIELRDLGSVPHGGIGMGVERFLRWILGLSHVRDVIPFPRTFRRVIYP